MSWQPFRRPEGGRIDRARPLRFRFDGREYQGYAGDTLASALLANGVRVVGRSFRLHRPRGIVAAGAEEPSAIVQIGAGARTEPNLKATQVPLVDGLEARAVNAWPSARFDIGAVLGLAAPLLPAGFYYKTFTWPSWRWFSPWIRRLGGLGRAPLEPDPDVYAKTFAACDILVIGGGPAGRSAALTAGRSGARVMLVDDQPALGGALIGQSNVIDDSPGLDWAAEAERELITLPEVRILGNATATGWYDHNLLTVVELCSDGHLRQRFWKIRARRVVLCAGAFERPLVFPGNDRPGVMLAGAVRTYALRFGVLAGRQIVVATNNDSAYAAALDLVEAGGRVVAILDSRPSPQGPEVEQLRAYGVTVLGGHAIVSTSGRSGVTSVTVAALDAEGRASGPRTRLACDVVAVSGGWSPTVHLYSQAGGRLAWDEASAQFVPTPDGVAGAETAGAAAGEMSLDGALRGGAEAGARAAIACGFAAEAAPPPTLGSPATLPIRQLWEVEGAAGAAWVDLQNDVTTRDIRQAAQENYASVEHLKRYTTLGMALDQGKTSNVNGIGVLSQALGRPISDIGTTRFRPPFNPVTLGAFAGRRRGADFRPLRRLPTDTQQRGLGATMDEYGGWLRPVCYAAAGETEEAAIRREVLVVRTGVGLYDASPLGKILVQGPDAGRFLDRIYVNTVSRLRSGRLRYGLMLTEQGAILDDGVVARLAPTRFLLGASSAHAGQVADWLEEWLQCEWPDLDVVVQPMTSAWATLTLAGPLSRQVLSALKPDLDLSDQRLPHMAWLETAIGSTDCRIARVSFTGERSYELTLPAEFGAALWDTLLDAGRPIGLAPVGLEAVMRLRLEKGFLHVGADTDTTTYPDDVGHALTGKAPRSDFIGRRSTMRAGSGTHRQLVGVEAVDPSADMPVGSHLTAGGSPARSEGWITSSGFSPTLGRWVALAMVQRGRERLGEALTLYDRGRLVPVRLCETCAYDPAGERLRA